MLSPSFTKANDIIVTSSFYTEGSRTATGEHYNKYGTTCAHKKLKFNTMLKLTNIRNNKVAVCRVNDRGPYIKGRDLDVSLKMAQMLDFVKAGTAKLKMEILSDVGTTVKQSVKEIKISNHAYTPRKERQK